MSLPACKNAYGEFPVERARTGLRVEYPRPSLRVRIFSPAGLIFWYNTRAKAKWAQSQLAAAAQISRAVGRFR